MLLPQNAEPRVIFGLMTFGPEEATREARITPLDEYNRWLDYFQQQGYNEVDSAGMYVGGRQEAWSREARWKERGLTMATKCYPRAPISHKPAVIREQLETSLKELGTECVDIFYLHAADRAVPSEETLEAVNQFHKEGKFVQLGLSNFTAFEVAEVIITCKANGWVRPSIYQGMYNAISGLFSAKIKSAEIPEEGQYRKVVKYGEMYRKRYFKDSTFEALRLMEETAKKHELTLLEIALRWCTHHTALKMQDGGRDGVIIRVSSFNQLESNLKDLEKDPLPEEVIKTLDEAWMLTKATTTHYWHLDLQYTHDT